MTNTVLAFFVLPAAFLVGSTWGAVGLSIAWLAIYPPYFALTLVRSGRVTPITLGASLRAIAPSAAAASVMYGVVVAVGTALPVGPSPILHLGLLIALGAMVYGGLMLVFQRAACLEAGALLVPQRFQIWRGATRSSP
jgi:hypothetical protein